MTPVMKRGQRIESAILDALPGDGPQEPRRVILLVSYSLRVPYDTIVGALWTLIEEGQIELLPDRRVRRAG